MHNWMIRIQQGNPHFGLMIHISFSPEQKLHDMFMAIVACRVQGCPSILKSCQKKKTGVWCTLNCKDNLEPHTACNLWKCSSHVNMLWANFLGYLFWWIYCAMSCMCAHSFVSMFMKDWPCFQKTTHHRWRVWNLLLEWGYSQVSDHAWSMQIWYG